MTSNITRRLNSAVPTLLLLALALSPSNALRQAGAAKVPQDLAELVVHAQDALKAGDKAKLRALVVKEEPMKWLDHRSARTRAGWRLALLPLPSPGNPGGYLAVFYDFHSCESDGDHIHPLMKTADGWRFGPEILETDPHGYRVRDHALHVEYDLPKGGCRITDSLRVERISPGQTVCLLRLSCDMQLDGAIIGGRSTREVHVPGLIAFNAPAAKTFTVDLAYHGTVDHPGSDYIRESEAVLTSYWYPHIGRLPAKHGVTVRVPSGWTAVGQGELRKSDASGANTFWFRNEIPTSYFTLDAGPYKITTREVDGRKLSVYELKPIEGRAARALDDLAKCLAFFEKSFGKYPYTHYEVVETLGPFGGALEAYSFSTYARAAFGAVVHEVAHTWWGGIVPNPYTKTLWNESFASYSDGLFRRQTRSPIPPHALTGQHQGDSRGRGMLQSYSVPISEAFDTMNGSHGAVGYGKGSLVLAMLEDLLGTETMISCMREFHENHVAHHSGDAADWPDFERAVKTVTGKDYGWFFRQWLDRPGVPLLKLANVKRFKEGDGFVLTADVVQEGAPYRLRLPVTVSTEDGKSVQVPVEVTGASTAIRIEAQSAPTSLTLDPDGTLLIAGAKLDDEKADALSAAITP